MMDVILNVYIGVESNLQKGESNDFADAALGYFNSPGRKGDLLLGVTVMSKYKTVCMYGVVVGEACVMCICKVYCTD